MARPKRLFRTVGVLVILAPSATADFINKFDICRTNVLGIIQRNETMGDINNLTIWDRGFIYTGPVHGPSSRYPREHILALTFEGCKTLCGPEVQLAEPRTALSMVATWIFPLAIVLSLPYDSMHRMRVRRTTAAVLNWLGSPQTALTATIHNFRQIREAHRRAEWHGEGDYTAWNDALYVLSCLNQFETIDPADEDRHKAFLLTLLYGLFRPTVHRVDDDYKDKVLIRELLSQLAFQLRMLRRRAVIPTLASLATFLVAFVFSVVLSFAEVGESATVDPLILGLLFSWLPVLVIFSIVDRNPVSSERTSVLISRWLHNVDAVMSWSRTGKPKAKIQWWGTKPPAEPEQPPGEPTNEATATEATEAPPPNQDIDPDPPSDGSDPAKEDTPTSSPSVPDPPKFPIGRFIGQGRSTQYAGLSWAVMAEIKPEKHPLRVFTSDYEAFAARAHARLRRRRPVSWFVTALISQLLVMTEVMLASMLAFNTPTVGLGCWSGSFGLYAILSSICWILALCFRKPGRLVTWLCYGFNVLAFTWLITVTMLVVTGGMNTCWCQASPFAYPQFGGYVTFENAAALRDMFDVVNYWAAAAGFGLAIPMIAFVVAVFWWLKCSHLWRANETRDAENELINSSIDWRWLT